MHEGTPRDGGTPKPPSGWENSYAWILRNIQAAPSRMTTENTNRRRFNYAANALLSTVDINMKSIKEWAMLDSGSTSHFLVTAAPITNITPASNPLTVKLPGGAYVSSTHTCTLTLPQLPTWAREGHIIP